jgi:hypothetical protein
MTKWEYFIFASDAPVRQDRLNELGQDGWELIFLNNFQSMVAVFKRPIQEKQQLNG